MNSSDAVATTPGRNKHKLCKRTSTRLMPFIESRDNNEKSVRSSRQKPLPSSCSGYTSYLYCCSESSRPPPTLQSAHANVHNQNPTPTKNSNKVSISTIDAARNPIARLQTPALSRSQRMRATLPTNRQKHPIKEFTPQNRIYAGGRSHKEKKTPTHKTHARELR